MQASLDDEELFSEASEEIESKVEESIEDFRSSLPDSTSIMEVEGENIVGVLNSFKSGLEAETKEPLREAIKWFEVGKRADAFDEEFIDNIEEEIDNLNSIAKSIDDAKESTMELTDAIAELKRSL